MLSTQFDMTLLGALLEMGGEELRTQLIADLRHAEKELETWCMVSGAGQSDSPQRLAQVLHNLRGLAMTVGADQLTAACRHAETLLHDVNRETLVGCLLRVVEESAGTRKAISSCNALPPT